MQTLAVNEGPDMSEPRTLYDKIWDDHLVHEGDDGTCLIYIDRHLVHEVPDRRETAPRG